VKGKDDIRRLVKSLLSANGDDGDVQDDESLLVSARLQSIDAVEVVVYLEENFGIDFAEIGFDRENIDSINAIYALTLSTSTPSNPT
jgi:acyl carrier protein